MDTPDTEALQRRLTQAWAECACCACVGDTQRLQDTRFVAAMLTLRIRHRLGSAPVPARPRACPTQDLDAPGGRPAGRAAPACAFAQTGAPAARTSGR